MENKKLLKLKQAKKRKQKRRIIISFILIGLFIGINIGYQKERILNNTEVQAKEAISNNIADEEISEEDVQESEANNLNNKDDEGEIVEFVEYTKYNESEKIKKIVEEYMQKNNLNKNNFAFFYYKPENEEKYFFNETTYFTAASTIKVPLAMVYYDKINHKDLKRESTLQYREEDYEKGAGKTTTDYKINDQIPISYLLEQMIINSDNTATNILKNALGGENAYRILIKQYTTIEFKSEFNNENITTASYLYDVLKRLYENKSDYEELIELMKRSSGGGYLKKEINDCDIAHKYGNFEGYVHDYGIIFTEHPYLIGIFTKDIQDPENIIADLSKKIYESEK